MKCLTDYFLSSLLFLAYPCSSLLILALQSPQSIDRRRDLIPPGEEKKIIFMTGDTFDPRAREFIQDTGNPIMLKPFTITQLLNLN